MQTKIQRTRVTWMVREAPQRSWIQPKKKAPPAEESWRTMKRPTSSPGVKPSVFSAKMPAKAMTEVSPME
jgi:hypothetical protein